MRSHFVSPRGDELVDDDLRAVGEVAELRFPQHQRVRVGQRVAVFEAQHAELGQQRVEDLEPRLAVADVVQRHVFGLVRLVDQHGVALAEGAALHVLARQADAVAFQQQGAEGQRLARRPVDALAAVDRLPLGFELAGDLRVDAEALRHARQRRADLAAAPRAARRWRAAAPRSRSAPAGLEAGPVAFQPVRLVRAGRICDAWKASSILALKASRIALDSVGRHAALLGQPLGVEGARGLHLADARCT